MSAFDIRACATRFASNQHGDGRAFMQAIARGRLQSVRKRVVNAAGDGALGGRLAAIACPQHVAWSAEIGIAQALFAAAKPAASALQLALAYLRNDAELDDFESELSAPQWLYFAGAVLHADGHCRIRRDGPAAYRLTLAGEDYRLGRDGRRWVVESDGELRWAVQHSDDLPFAVAQSGIVLDREGFPYISDYPHARAGRDPAELARVMARISAGWALIEKAFPAYAPWVRDAMADALVVRNKDPDINTSGSAFDFPGLVYLEASPSATKVAECLVHECSHQYLNALHIVSPVVRLDDREAFYSPIKGVDRSTYNVLTAAHALANMMRLYSRIRECVGLDDDEADKLKIMVDWFFSDYCEALDRSKALTETGRIFWNATKAGVAEYWDAKAA